MTVKRPEKWDLYSLYTLINKTAFQVRMTMKKFAFWMMGILTLSACSKQEEGDYQLEYRMRIEIPASANPLLTHVFEQRLPSAWISFLQSHGLKAEDIRLIRPREVVLSPVLEERISYQLIEQAHASVFDPFDPSGKIYVGDVYDNLEDRNPFYLLPGLANVTPVLMQPEFILQLELKLKAVPGVHSEHYVDVLFDVFLN